MSPTTRLLALARDYATFLREERRARAYLGAVLVDDVGIAVSGWAATLIMTNLAETQAARATLMIPALVCFLLGTLVSGPLADWLARTSPAELARWRWKVVLAGRAIETGILGVLVVQLALGPPTIARVLPFVMVSAFMKTALRATRIAYSVDLLDHETAVYDAAGVAKRDENGAPLRHKTHLLPFFSLVTVSSTAALLLGLVTGGRIMEVVGESAWILFAIDVITNLGFVALVHRLCRPDLSHAESFAPPAPEPRTRIGRVWESFAGGFRFLARPEQRPLLALLGGSFLVEVITEAYDGRMIIQHVLHGGDDAVRHAELGWVVVSMVGAALLPLFIARGGGLGKLFLAAMLLDGIVIALAGHVASIAAPVAVLPFALVLGVDRALTLISGTISDVAQNSVSSAAMRGRIAGTLAIVVIVGDIASELVATAGEEAWGIPGLVARAGLLQIVLVVLLGLLGGRGLWRFGLRSSGEGSNDASGAPALIGEAS